MTTFNSRFGLADRVQIDNSDVRGVVTGVGVFPVGVRCMVSWFAQGVLQEQWVDEFRLVEFKE